MPENLLIPSVDLRVGSLEEYNRRQREKAAQQHRTRNPAPASPSRVNTAAKDTGLPSGCVRS